VPGAVLAAYGFGADVRAEPLGGGLINQTFVLRDGDGEVAAVLQRLHPVFGPAVNDDIDAVTRFLDDRGVLTPRLIHTTDGQCWVDHDGACWRALTYVSGRTVDAIADPAQARSAGALVGRFHRVMAAYDGGFVHVRANVHDTATHLSKLDQRVADRADAGVVTGEALGLGRDILDRYQRVPAVYTARGRNVHGDLKISNVLFAADDATRATCLIDLDTLGEQPLAFELGDMLRSWANPAGESTPTPAIDADIVAAALEGYATEVAGLFEEAEYASIIPGLELICIELAARFCVDVFDDSYFAWDASVFASRREHNLVRARGQLALAESVAAQRAQLDRICMRALGG